MARTQQRYRPEITHAGLAPTHPVSVVDEFNRSRDVEIPGESPLTLYVDEREIVTLMTIGAHPEALALGYLRNQRFVERLEQIESVRVDHHTESVRVTTHDGIEGWDEKLKKRTVTTGCGQGTVFSCTLDSLYTVRLPDVSIRQSTLYALLENVSGHNGIYRRAGAVHGCGLCLGDEILMYTEDVGRHNAVDKVVGELLSKGLIPATELGLIVSGRASFELTQKTVMAGMPLLAAVSAPSSLAVELAREFNVTLVGFLRGETFNSYAAEERIV